MSVNTTIEININSLSRDCAKYRYLILSFRLETGGFEYVGGADDINKTRNECAGLNRIYIKNPYYMS